MCINLRMPAAGQRHPAAGQCHRPGRYGGCFWLRWVCGWWARIASVQASVPSALLELDNTMMDRSKAFWAFRELGE
jgi:hypothetical protein